MANILIFNETTGRAVQFIKSANTPSYAQRSDVLINPVMPEVELKYVKVESGIAVEMTQVEKDAVDLALAPDYAELRAAAYPGLPEQLDMLYHSMDSNEIPKSQAFYDAIKTVKEAYPKP